MVASSFAPGVLAGLGGLGGQRHRGTAQPHRYVGNPIAAARIQRSRAHGRGHGFHSNKRPLACDQICKPVIR